MDDVVRQVAAPYGVDVHLEHTRGVPPVVNSEHETALIEASARAELGENAVVLTPQSMGGEDFAWFLADLPGGAMMRLARTPPVAKNTTSTVVTSSLMSAHSATPSAC